MAHPPGDAIGQQAGQRTVDGRVGLAKNARQRRRIDERRPAECVEQLSVGDCHMSRVAKESPDGHPTRVSTGHRSPFSSLQRMTEDLTNPCPLTIPSSLIIMMPDTSGKR